MSEDPIERGLAEAFGGGGVQRPVASVLRALQARANSILGVHLDAQDDDDAQVKVTDEVKALRDPSGRYQILGEIGRGGVGIVYKGRDSDLGRDVAMKVLKDEYADRPDVLARFVEEAQIGGQLQHPGIVPVYELGLHAGERPYFAMKLVKGETLAAQLARRSDPAQDRRRLLGIFEQVCQTMAYAHARRVIHRDLKPTNVMIGAFGEVQVIDWGFAKVMPKGGVADETESLTRASERSVIETVRSAPGSGSNSVAGSVLGTPAYTSPEQANGDVERMDRRSDVFGLGAILCEILTGEAPYREADGDLVRQAAMGALDGALERLRKCGADPALVTLCTECLARARRARPESAAEVAERVSAYLTSVEERAREAELRAAEARYRHRTTLLSTGVGLVVVMLAAGAWIWNADQAETRRAEAMQRVAGAMSTASGARGQAQAAGLDAVRWAAAVSSAEQVVALTDSVDVDANARAEAESLLGRIRSESWDAEAEAQRLERDARMRERLVEVRIPIEDQLRVDGWEERESRRLDAEYASAFTEYLGGESLLEMSIESTLESMRLGDIEVELSTSLDHWFLTRQNLPDSGVLSYRTGTARIRELAMLLDPNEHWRSRLRDLLPDAYGAVAELRRLADEADFESLTPAGCHVLSEALCQAGDKPATVRVLRRAQELHPQDFDLCYGLAMHLELLPEPDWQGALDTYRIAHALKPEHKSALHRQGVALENLGRHADAEQVFRRGLARDPTDSHLMRHVGVALAAQGRSEAAMDFFQRALEAAPGEADSYKMIGAQFLEAGRFDEAIETYYSAIVLAPTLAVHHFNLGTALLEAGENEAAVQSLQRALELDPRYASAHANLGNALSNLNDMDRAAASYERALELGLEDSWIHFNLGNSLRRLGKPRKAAESFERAIECYARALEIQPNHARTHHNLGVTLEAVGRFEDAIESYRNALDADPQLGSSRRRLMRLEGADDLEEVLTGRREAESSDQWDVAVLIGCQAGRWAEVVTLTEETLSRSPELIDSGSSWGAYNPACAAALLAADSSSGTTADERARVRHLALTWLARESERWQVWIAEGGDRAALAGERLAQAASDPDFASVRDDALEELPAAERDAWEELWSEIGRARGEGRR
ncbi:MAG: tetratricopeptide repeat protein [Planctomycetota bacterium]|nr:MAG: tetratricopeptide repeat protein [Planctomycetota bacterium]